MKADLRTILYGDDGFASRVDGYREGRAPKYPAGVPVVEAGGPHVPHTLKIQFATPQELGGRTVEKIPVSHVGPGNLLAERVEAALVAVYGPTPHGHVEITLAPDGEFSSPPVRLSRRCYAPDMSDTGMSLDVYRSLLARSEAERSAAVAALLQSHAVQGQIISSQAAHIATISTARTASNGAAELSSPMAIIGGVVFFAMMPALKKVLGLPESADLSDVLAAGVKAVSASSNTANKATRELVAIPAMARVEHDDDDGDRNDGQDRPDDEAPPDAEPDGAPVDASTSTTVDPADARRLVALALRLSRGSKEEREAAGAEIADAALRGGVPLADLMALQASLTPS